MFECCQNVNSSNHPIFTSACVLGQVSEVKNMPYLKGKVKDYFGVHQVNHAVSVKWITLNGNKYICEKTLLVCMANSSSLPEFGLVRIIYVINSSLYCFVCQRYSTVCFDRDYMSYKIEVPNLAEGTELINADDLVDFTPYYSFNHKDMTYVPMEYYLGDVIELHKASNV